MGSSSQGDILIAVLGVTGAGKTTFISKATGRTDLAIGHGLTSCTFSQILRWKKQATNTILQVHKTSQWLASNLKVKM